MGLTGVTGGDLTYGGPTPVATDETYSNREYKPRRENPDALRSRVLMRGGVLYVSDCGNGERRPLIECLPGYIRVGCTTVTLEAWKYLTARWGYEEKPKSHAFAHGFFWGLFAAAALAPLLYWLLVR